MNITSLISRLAEAERSIEPTAFFAPCVWGGRLRVRIEGLVREYRPEPASFEGWGVFRSSGSGRARLVEEGRIDRIESYLSNFPQLRVRLARQLSRRTWIAAADNRSELRQRFGVDAPLLVHLVDQIARFELVIARYDGANWWYDRADGAADPRVAERLREGLRDQVDPDELRVRDLSRGSRDAYALAFSETATARREAACRQLADRVATTLERAGARLRDMNEHADRIVVEWESSTGERHVSAISGRDLAVVGAGICLSGRDSDFDLQSLVGVVEGRPDWMR